MTSLPSRRNRSVASSQPLEVDGSIGSAPKKQRHREPVPVTLVEVAGFALNEKEHDRFQQLIQRAELRDPAAFKLELYDEFVGEGFVEVMENGLRSCWAKCGPGGSALLSQLLPLSAFFALRAKDAAAALGDGTTVVDLLLEVLSSLWRLALSNPVVGVDTQFDAVRRFRDLCVDSLEMYADWSWLEEADFEPVAAAAVPGAVRDAVASYLATRYPWQKDDDRQMLERQSEFVITAKMTEALRADTAPAPALDDASPRPKPPMRVMAALRSLR